MVRRKAEAVTAPGRCYVAASHAVLREGESLTSRRCGSLPQSAEVVVERLSGGRALLSEPESAAGLWASVVARSGDVVLGRDPAADVAAPEPAAAGREAGAEAWTAPRRSTPAAPYKRSEAVAAAKAEVESHPAGTWTAVLVRTHRPSKAALERMASWAAELKRERGWQLWVQVDLSPCGSRRPDPADLQKSLAEVAPGRVHGITEDDMLAAFPALADAPWPRGAGQSLAYGFHCEAVALWHRAHGDGCAAVWVLEDDVACSGAILPLLSSYDSGADLVTLRWAQRHPGWPWKGAASPGFAEACPSLRDQLFSREHVQRWSGRLIVGLDALSRNGVTAWSEMATPSLCRRLGLVEGLLRPEHIGEKFAWNSRVGREEWAQRCSEDAAPRLYHALKW